MFKWLYTWIGTPICCWYHKLPFFDSNFSYFAIYYLKVWNVWNGVCLLAIAKLLTNCHLNFSGFQSSTYLAASDFTSFLLAWMWLLIHEKMEWSPLLWKHSPYRIRTPKMWVTQFQLSDLKDTLDLKGYIWQTLWELRPWQGLTLSATSPNAASSCWDRPLGSDASFASTSTVHQDPGTSRVLHRRSVSDLFL